MNLKFSALKTFPPTPAYKYALYSVFILYISQGFALFITLYCRCYNVVEVFLIQYCQPEQSPEQLGSIL